MQWYRIGWVLALLGLLGCTAPEEDLSVPPEPLGDFRLGHTVIVAEDMALGPFSRSLPRDEIKTEVADTVNARLRRYDGDGLYHLGVYLGGLVLAQPGIPIVFAPPSVIIVDVTLFDNRTKAKLNEEPKRLTVGEGLRNAAPILGSGLVRSGPQQLENLSVALAREIEAWLAEHPDWFTGQPGDIRVPFDPAEFRPEVANTGSALRP